MPDIPDIYETETWTQIVILTGLLGGGCAWQTGRAIALTWRPWWHIPASMLLLGLAVRFFHFALMDSPLWAGAAFVTDTLFLLIVANLSWRYTRAGQMSQQYFWLYERRGPLNWRARNQVAVPERAENA
ncbi:MAG: hypothetical protein EPO23_09540 [Xanthobacteraceae bacterium]|nr:MAG: hypothetical protein EPO23_09540 [Xanthobacteraceae bacterium]